MGPKKRIPPKAAIALIADGVKKGLSSKEVLKCVRKHWGTNILEARTINRWYAKFEKGRTEEKSLSSFAINHRARLDKEAGREPKYVGSVANYHRAINNKLTEQLLSKLRNKDLELQPLFTMTPTSFNSFAESLFASFDRFWIQHRAALIAKFGPNRIEENKRRAHDDISIKAIAQQSRVDAKTVEGNRMILPEGVSMTFEKYEKLSKENPKLLAELIEVLK